jgi:hypothetical protein
VLARWRDVLATGDESKILCCVGGLACYACCLSMLRQGGQWPAKGSELVSKATERASLRESLPESRPSECNETVSGRTAREHLIELPKSTFACAMLSAPDE